MPTKGYTSIQAIESVLGQALTPTASEAMTRFLPGLERFIDSKCGRAWMMGVQTDEKHWSPWYNIYLKYPPITSVATVKGRSGIGEADETLTVDDDWELRDPESGHIYISSPGAYDLVKVTYTPDATLPDDVGMLATELGAMRARLILEGTGLDVQSYSAGGEVQVAHFGGNMLPRHLQDVIDLNRFTVVG